MADAATETRRFGAGDKATVRAPEATEEMLATMPSFIAPAGVGTYAACKDDARLYLRVVLGDETALPAQSDVSGFLALLEEVA
jgi:hypothetical protein